MRALLRSVLAVCLLCGASAVTSTVSQQPRAQMVPTGYDLDTPGLERPTIEKMTMPFYPASATEKKVEGSLSLKIVVGADGSVSWAEVAKSLDKMNGVDEQAMFAISKWVFKPGTLNGKPVAVSMTCHLSFALPGKVGLSGLSR